MQLNHTLLQLDQILQLIFPAASSAVQVMVVVPIWKALPDSAEHVGPALTPTLSVAVSTIDSVSDSRRLISISSGTSQLEGLSQE